MAYWLAAKPLTSPKGRRKKKKRKGKRKMAQTMLKTEAERLGVLDQVARSGKRGNRLGTAVGAVLGGFVPLASYTMAHSEAAANPVMWVLVAAGLGYSATTVFDWARVAFKNPIKALGFVALLEGVMTFSRTHWLGIAGLALLIAINATATGCNLVADKRQAASARRGRR
jgi:VIT1/CCC1 family predicted Fe2+/Mn2+ transporter